MNGSTEEQDDRFALFWDEKIGPFYDAEGLLQWFGYTQEFLDDCVRAREVLEVVSGDGLAIFPSFQFGANGTLLPHLAEMLQVIDPFSRAPWGNALWLNAPEDDLDGMTPAEALRADRADDALMIGGQAGAHWFP